MMEMEQRFVSPLIEDSREIFAIGGVYSAIFVGSNGVTKIVPYHENGQMAAVPWFAVYCGDEIWRRYDAAGMWVEYRTADVDGIPF